MRSLGLSLAFAAVAATAAALPAASASAADCSITTLLPGAGILCSSGSGGGGGGVPGGSPSNAGCKYDLDMSSIPSSYLDFMNDEHTDKELPANDGKIAVRTYE